MYRRISGWFAALTLAALTVVLPARAELVVGRDYVPIVPAQASDNPAKLEVIEFFSYGCPHCSEFHPTVSKWSAALPGDVVFKRVPISFARPQWASLARLYYALEATGDLARLDAAVFEALHKTGSKLYDDKSIIDWLSAHGVDSKKLSDADNSCGVISKASGGEHMSQADKVQSVPYRAVGAARLLRDNLLIYGLGGLLVPFIGIKAIDMVIAACGLA